MIVTILCVCSTRLYYQKWFILAGERTHFDVGGMNVMDKWLQWGSQTVLVSANWCTIDVWALSLTIMKWWVGVICPQRMEEAALMRRRQDIPVLDHKTGQCASSEHLACRIGGSLLHLVGFVMSLCMNSCRWCKCCRSMCQRIMPRSFQLLVRHWSKHPGSRKSQQWQSPLTWHCLTAYVSSVRSGAIFGIRFVRWGSSGQCGEEITSAVVASIEGADSLLHFKMTNMSPFDSKGKGKSAS